jgi:hypothetical protein
MKAILFSFRQAKAETPISPGMNVSSFRAFVEISGSQCKDI